MTSINIYREMNERAFRRQERDNGCATFALLTKGLWQGGFTSETV